MLYAAPAVLLTSVFFLVPLLGTVWTSLRKQPLYGPSTFIGIDNYVNAFHDPMFWSAVWFTFRFMLVTLSVGTVLSFLLALLVSQPRRGVGFFRTAFFLPVTMGYASAGFLWYYMLDGRVGVINDMIIRLGLSHDAVAWLSDAKTSFWAIAVLTIWKSAGFAMVIFLIGIQAIPQDLFEAFRVDGATRFQTICLLVIPLLRNNIALVVILGVVGGMLTFDQFFTMTKGGPSGSTMTAVYSLYANAFDFQKLGYGSALSVILLGMLAIVSAVQLYFFRPKS
jgi:multiple sugar transport system permease protein